MLVLPEIQLVPGTRTSDFFTPDMDAIERVNISIFALLFQNKENKTLFGHPIERLKDTNGRDMSTVHKVFVYTSNP